MERKNQHSLLEWPPFQPQKRHKTSDFIFLVEIYVSRNQKKKIKFLLSATNINSLEGNLATPRKAGYKPPMSQESCCQVSPQRSSCMRMFTPYGLVCRPDLVFCSNPVLLLTRVTSGKWIALSASFSSSRGWG